MALSNAMHLVMELAWCNKAKLSDPVFIKNLLDSIPARVGMTVMQECTPIRLDAEDPLDSGWTAVTILSESHISIHAFENMSFCFLDIFSCRNYDWRRLYAE